MTRGPIRAPPAAPTLRARPADVDRWVCDLGIAREAAELHGASDVIDLHVDTFIWTRLFGYDLTRRHGPGPLPGWCARQVDLPRLVDAGVGGAVWAITTNPFANGDELRDGLLANLERLTSLLNRSGAAVVVRTPAEYRKARLTGRHGAFLALQGGNALAYDLDLLERLPGDPLVLVTLVHMTDSDLGATSSPLRLGPDRGLSRRGRDLVDALEARRILVDLAHIGRRGFWNAVDMHDRTRPLIVSHTGASGIHPHWRNLDDAQLRAIADSGGTVGIIYHASYLGDPLWRGRALSVVRHLEHVIETVGEDHASLGSDWDGLIVTPRDLRTASELPRLTALLLRRGHSPERVRKLLGGNFLRVLGEGR